MLFNSYEFLLLFLPVALAGFFALGHRGKFMAAIAWLAGISLVFYAWWNPRYLVLLLASIVFNYLVGRHLGKSPERQPSDQRMLVLGIACNLLLLAYYKYAGFFVANLQLAFGLSWHLDNIVLPLGISFFTFTQIAYLVDAYRKEVREYRFFHYLLFVTFFPHLIAGPVLHHAEIMPQFRQPETYRVRLENFSVGLTIFVIGLFKKVMLADSIASYASPVFAAAQAGETITGLAAWGGALAYAFQIYFDFSGYSDMAIGLARMFGIVFPANFDSPYKANSIIDFWRRWHMTLSRFLRDYLYIPLGGSRCGPVRRQGNLLATMLLGGLWHGAGWTFVIWGALHGIFLIVNHLWRTLASSATWLRFPLPLGIGPLLGRILTFLCVVVAWVFFRAESLDAAFSILRGMAGLNGFPSHTPYYRGVSELKFILVCWIIAWAAPNVQDIMRDYRPALDTYASGSRPGRGGRFIWCPNARWAAAMAFLGVAAFIELTEISEFLYFQF